METKNPQTESSKKFSCSICSQTFKYKSKLLRHDLIHSKVKLFKCCYCNKSFSLSYNLKIHLRVHTGVKPYACRFPGCKRKFNQSNNLTVHYKTHRLDAKQSFPLIQNSVSGDQEKVHFFGFSDSECTECED